MVSRKHRFHGLGSVRPIYRHGDQVRTTSMSLKYRLNNRRDTYRVAVVVSKKVHKSAVVRNRIRRRIYEIVRTKEAKIKDPYDIVITVFNDQVADVEHKDLEKSATALLRKAKIVR